MLKDTDKHRSLAVFVAIHSLGALDRQTPPIVDLRGLVNCIRKTHARIATPLDRNFSSSIVHASSHKRLYIYLGSVTGNRSQTLTKVSSNGVLLINIAIATFAKIPYGGFSQIWSQIGCVKDSAIIYSC